MSKPNILFLMTDQQRWDAMGCSGTWVETPHLDRIAGEGVRFENCVTTTPICVPTRVALATGRYPHSTTVWDNVDYTLPPETPTWMQVIRDAGYSTSLFGKTHLHPHEGDIREKEHLLHAYGLDVVDEIGGPRASGVIMSHMTARWEALGLLESYRQDYVERFANKAHVVRPSVLPLEEYADVYVGQRACEHLERYDGRQPWFCWVSFGGPHEPWDTPEPWASLYDPAAMPEPVPRPARTDRPDGSLDHFFERHSPVFEPGEPQRMRADYAGNVSLIDDQIGRVLRVIEQRGELDNTVIVFTSDHGEMNGDYGLIYKMNFLDGAVRVPMLIRTPQTLGSAVAGSVNRSPAELLDLGPTLVELAGGEYTHEQFGQSLLPATLDPGRTHRTEAIAEFRGEIMIMDEQWKMAVNRLGEPYLLFDRKQDPREVDNLAARPDMKAVEDRLRLRILERVLQSQVRITKRMPPLINEQAIPRG